MKKNIQKGRFKYSTFNCATAKDEKFMHLCDEMNDLYFGNEHPLETVEVFGVHDEKNEEPFSLKETIFELCHGNNKTPDSIKAFFTQHITMQLMLTTI